MPTNLLTNSNAGTPAQVYEFADLVDDVTIEGGTDENDPISVKDLGISTGKIAANAVTNAKLAQVASKRYKGRTSALTGDVEDLTAAQMQADLSVDDLITLSGVTEGAVNLGTFTGAAISDNRTVKQALQDLETAVEAAVGLTINRVSNTSGTNANNQTRVGYVILTGTPTVTFARAGETGTTPTLTIDATGGTIRIVELFNTFENTSGSTATLDMTINGVGSNEYDAVPFTQKILHNQAFSAASPASNCQFDNDNSPACQPFGYSSASMGTIKLRLTNLPTGDRYALKAKWSEN